MEPYEFEAPPNDVNAERIVIGSALESDRILAELRMTLTDDGGDFYTPAAAEAWRVMVRLADDGHPVEAASVLAAASGDPHTRRLVTAQLLGAAVAESTPASAGFYAQRVAYLGGLRRIIVACNRGANMATAGGVDADGSLLEIGERVVEQIQQAMPTTTGAAKASLTVREFTEQPDEQHTWLVDQLIEREDVFMILAGEGVGKTVLSRQMIMAIGQGVSPFRQREQIAPRRTLLVDLENARGLARRNMRDGRERLESLTRQQLNDNAHVWMRPEGLNLRRPSDAALLEREIESTGAELVAFGSLYKSFLRNGDDWETAADEVRAVFDRLRAKYGCAFWLEHHMPKGDGTTRPQMPFGSSVWQRWAGFGRVLERVGPNMFRLAPSFRGDREPRQIPIALTRGGDYGLHWQSVWDDQTMLAGCDPAQRQRLAAA